jgi:hypothetical protein
VRRSARRFGNPLGRRPKRQAEQMLFLCSGLGVMGVTGGWKFLLYYNTPYAIKRRYE